MYNYVFECSINKTHFIFLHNLVYIFLSFTTHNIQHICIHIYLVMSNSLYLAFEEVYRKLSNQIIVMKKLNKCLKYATLVGI